MLYLRLDTYGDIDDFLLNEKSLFFKEIISTIEKCLDDNEPSGVVAEFEIGSEITTIEVEEDGWYESIEFALAYFESIEDYEYCENIKSLINRLND
jgi:hypothetical protein